MAQVAQQEKELDEAYDAVEKILRATECKDSTPVRSLSAIPDLSAYLESLSPEHVLHCHPRVTSGVLLN